MFATVRCFKYIINIFLVGDNVEMLKFRPLDNPRDIAKYRRARMIRRNVSR